MPQGVRWTLERVQEVVALKGGTCISDQYVNTETKMQFRCANGHEWETRFRGILGGNWCPKCASGRRSALFRLSLKTAQDCAAQKGGACLSETYQNTRQYLKWQCQKKHEWEAPLTSIQQGRWCPHCNPYKKLDGIRKAMEIADAKGGKFISGDYQSSSSSKLLMECAEGHRWYATLINMHHGDTWCPTCSGHRREKECLALFEELLGVKFAAQASPQWLARGGKRVLRLDGLHEDLGLAFEYNGKQHYHYVPLFHRDGPEDLEKQQNRDAFVQEACSDNWITLVVVPYTVQDLRAFIRHELEILGYIEEAAT